MADFPLPIDDVLEDVQRALARPGAAVLVAPPGAGKTTRVPLALLDAPWLAGARILVLEPRRLAARAAAERMASLLGERVGETVGIRARLDTRVGPGTRIEVITEGVFTRLVIDDPALTGVGAVLFDEFHERSLDADLGLALLLDARAGLREDLRLLVMSATLDAAPVSALIGDAPVIVSEGRAFPIDTRYLGRPADLRIEEPMAAAVLRAHREEAGSILAFLPGQGEIRRLAERLRERLTAPDTDVVELHGGLDGRAQRQAIQPARDGRRKIVLATSIAQTSITIEGVRVVVDCGLERVPRYEPDSGITRLETIRASRATVDQRRGRAGRTEPGVCYRLWDEPATAGLAAYTTPEIRAADLAPLLLDCAAWGVTDPAKLAWLDLPPEGAVSAAREELALIGAIAPDGALTDAGRCLRALPLPPRLASMLLGAVKLGAEEHAAEIAAVLVERGLGGTSVDLDERLDQLRRDRSERAVRMRRLAADWARTARALAGSAHAGRDPDTSTAALLVLAFPDRIARQRGANGTYLLAGGRGAVLDPALALARETFLVVADLSGAAAAARILAAARLNDTDLETVAAGRIETRAEVSFDAAAMAVRARRSRRLDAIVLESTTQPVPPTLETAGILAAGLAQAGIDRLPWSKEQLQLRDRVAFIRARKPEDDSFPDLSDTALAGSVGQWLAPSIVGALSATAVTPDMLNEALRGLLPYALRRRLDEMVPTHFEAPTGNRHAIDYESDGAPVLAIRVQELFGLKQHPAIGGGRVPLTLHLLSPAHRPIQITRDLPGFWRGSWREVRSEMKGRYPRHVWPEDPETAVPTTRAKPRK